MNLNEKGNTSMMSIPRWEHPRPDRKRDAWINLNGTWDFEIDNAKVGLEKKFYERESLEGKITVPFSPESVLSGVGHTDFMNAVWYRRSIAAITSKTAILTWILCLVRQDFIPFPKFYSTAF